MTGGSANRLSQKESLSVEAGGAFRQGQITRRTFLNLNRTATFIRSRLTSHRGSLKLWHEESALVWTSARRRQPFELGPLEVQVMEVLWAAGHCTVRDVVDKLNNGLAYTTVMTTLDRLFKKRLLDRQRAERAFVYFPAVSGQEWERKRAGDLVAGFLAGPEPSRELLLSSLVDAVGEHDLQLLEELEEKIREKLRELA